MRHTVRLNLAAAAVAAFLAGTLAGPAPAQPRLWNYPVVADADTFEAQGPAGALRIVGARNGSFSAAVAVESDSAITGLRAAAGELTGEAGVIAADDVQVRYAVRWDTVTRRRPDGLDVLLEQPPQEVDFRRRLDNALAGVWVTVHVPADAAPGEYRGELHVAADGLDTQRLPIELTVTPWTVPDADNFRTWIGVIQSPDTLALEYELEMWSERHWELIERSFELLAATGTSIVYVPLIAQTNYGNEQTMVRWIETASGAYEHDFSIMERYLDVAEAHLGELEHVVFVAWDIELAEDPPTSQHVREEARERREGLADKGPGVTLLERDTGEVSLKRLPTFEDPRARELWRPVFDELRRRMGERGLEDAMVLGMRTDVHATREEVALFHELSGGLPWAAEAHPTRLRGQPAVGNRLMYGLADIAYEAHVYHIRYQVNPEHVEERAYGWQREELNVFFGRNGVLNNSAFLARVLPEMTIIGEQRGLGRIGGDTWYVLRDRRDRRSGAVYHRYPENNWRNLGIESWLLAPGETGPVATARLEALREGLQETEARILIESVLIDDARRGRVGEALARDAQALLDERQLAMWRGVWEDEQAIRRLGDIEARNPWEAVWGGLDDAGVEMPQFWSSEARQLRRERRDDGQDWFARSDWQQRNARLFEYAERLRQRIDGGE